MKREKARRKSNFTRIKNKVLFLIEQRELPSQHEIQDACSRMDNNCTVGRDGRDDQSIGTLHEI